MYILKSIVARFTARRKGNNWGGRTIDEVCNTNLAAGRLVIGWGE